MADSKLYAEKCANCKTNDIDYGFHLKNPDMKNNKSKFCSTACAYEYWEKLREGIRKEYEKRGK